MHNPEWLKQKREQTDTEIELQYLQSKKKVCKSRLKRWLIGLQIAIDKKYIKKLQKNIAYIEEHEDD